MIYCFDIDGTICTNTMGDYPYAKPLFGRIKKINKLYDDGHTIILFTSRGVKTDIDWSDFTHRQLEAWGLKFHSLHMGKPEFDVFVDDKATDPGRFFEDSVGSSGVETWCCGTTSELGDTSCDDDCKCFCHVSMKRQVFGMGSI